MGTVINPTLFMSASLGSKAPPTRFQHGPNKTTIQATGQQTKLGSKLDDTQEQFSAGTSGAHMSAKPGLMKKAGMGGAYLSAMASAGAQTA